MSIARGFHLARASADEIAQTITCFQSLQPKFVVPSHCTGFQAIRQFAQAMPDAFVEGMVGATYHL